MGFPVHDSDHGLRRLLGGSMHEVRRSVARAAAAESPVLLLGETGTGKGVVAQALHEISPRRAGPLVHVDCAALAPTVFESELFGHERGAFTGAVARHRGRFERARGGTLFLDEVGELPLAFQSKLLTALESGRIERLGGAQTVRVDARIVAATNRDLAEEVGAGRFRLDLYHRLRVLEIVLPPLRDRLSDVPELVRAHLPRLAARAGVRTPRLADGFLAALAERVYPGNVRELLHEVERALVRSRGAVLDAAALGPPQERDAAPPSAAPRRTAHAGGPADEIERVLRATGGNVSRAARRLGISRGTLRYRIAQHGLAGVIPRD